MTTAIALPTYNGARHLRAQLDSIAAQTRRPDELVVCDDASTDDTLAIVAAFAPSAPFPVRVIHAPGRSGLNANFARAIAACAADVIALSDQDDVWLPTHLERLAAPLEADPAVGLAISNSAYVDEALRPMGRMTLWSAERFGPADLARVRRGPQFREWLRHHVVAGHASAFRADLRDAILPFGLNNTYDHWLSLVCAALSKVVLIDETLTLHRHHASQAVANREVSLTQHARQHAAVPAVGFAVQADEWRALAARLEPHRGRWTSPDVGPLLARRVELSTRRQRLREGGPLRRVAGAVATLASGRYHRDGRGWLTFARDVRG